MSAVGLMSVEQQVKEERWAWGRKEQRQTKPTRTDWNPHQPLPTSPSNFSNINDSQKLLLQGDAYAPGRGQVTDPRGRHQAGAEVGGGPSTAPNTRAPAPTPAPPFLTQQGHCFTSSLQISYIVLNHY